MDIVIDLTPYGHVTTHGWLIAASPDAVIVDTPHGLALCDNPMPGNPLASVVDDIEVLRTCPHELRAIVQAYMIRTRVG